MNNTLRVVSDNKEFYRDADKPAIRLKYKQYLKFMAEEFKRTSQTDSPYAERDASVASRLQKEYEEYDVYPKRYDGLSYSPSTPPQPQSDTPTVQSTTHSEEPPASPVLGQSGLW